jgi:hypothetical protein
MGSLLIFKDFKKKFCRNEKKCIVLPIDKLLRNY